MGFKVIAEAVTLVISDIDLVVSACRCISATLASPVNFD
jgi:hypothetical protein